MFQLDLKSRKSICEQVVDGCKDMVISGELQPGDRLMSVREMSAALTVNPNTIQKAYARLEQDGWIFTVAGRGAFVSEEAHEPDLRQIEDVYKEIESLISRLVYLGEKKGAISERLGIMTDERRVDI